MTLTVPSKLSIVIYPDPVLRNRCAPVVSFTPELRALSEKMLRLMRNANGVGLAAPQVGISTRLFVCNPTGEQKDDLVVVNPRFIELAGGEEGAEGCLSIPEVTVNVRRATHALLEAEDIEGNTFRVAGDGLPARVWQHETDHLDGRLIIDQMSTSDEIANRRAIKQLKDKRSK